MWLKCVITIMLLHQLHHVRREKIIKSKLETLRIDVLKKLKKKIK